MISLESITVSQLRQQYAQNISALDDYINSPQLHWGSMDQEVVQVKKSNLIPIVECGEGERETTRRRNDRRREDEEE